MSISPTLAEMQRNGFPIGGESSVAVDLVDTVVRAHTTPTDLLLDGADVWWGLQAARLPKSPIPPAAATQRLRSALRAAFEARIDGLVAGSAVVDELNRVAYSVPSSPQLVVENGQARVITRWHPGRGGNPRLAAMARDGIAIVGDPERSALLRRCANPTCSMIFLAENPRRLWCAPNVCGNRVRVSRHQQRQRQTGEAPYSRPADEKVKPA
jgi:predicted RNA-binding Zn ribbon-like protein